MAQNREKRSPSKLKTNGNFAAPKLRIAIPERQAVTPSKLIDAPSPMCINGVTMELHTIDFTFHHITGQGAFGTVHKAMYNPTNTLMAVKKINYTSTEEKRVLLELAVNKKSISCPYAVQFYGSLLCEGDVWICMEFMDLSTEQLNQVLYKNNRRIPENVVGKIAAAAVLALHTLQDLQIMHRDVKPSNILINNDGCVKLCDFGISRFLSSSLKYTTEIGAKAYMAPERIDSNSYDFQADVWSLGISLIELATGEFPFHNWRDIFQQISEIVLKDPPSLDSEKFSPDLVNFVKTCLIKNPKDRPTFKELKDYAYIKKYKEEQVDAAQLVKDTLMNYQEDLTNLMCKK